MMINRQLEMIYILMNKGTVTAEELAEHFEVSTRTIYRDVENLSMSGIPIYAERGKGGGIRLMERFVLDKLLLSREEQQRILAALASLKETGASGEEKILKKLETFFRTEPVDWVAIDFSDWSGRRVRLFEQIKEAILNRHVLEFDYYGQYGDMSHRQAEPVQLLFKEYTWYVRAWCRVRGAMRLFKVQRMKRVETLEEVFETGLRHRGEEEKKNPEAAAGESKEECLVPEKTISFVAVENENRISSKLDEEAKAPQAESEVLETEVPEIKTNIPEKEAVQKNDGSVSAEVVFRIDRKEAYRVYDRFDEDEITVLPEGDFEIRFCCPIDNWVYGLILSFGPSARVLRPEWIRKEMENRIRQMLQSYETL